MNGQTLSRSLSLRLVLILLVTGAAFLMLRPPSANADGGELIVVSIGDSVAAGEGAPDVPASFPNAAEWKGWYSGPGYSDPTTCHRSNRSGPARMYHDYIKPRYPNNSLFINFACSGAGIFNGLIGPQLNDDGTVKVNKSQIQQVKDWMQANRPGRRIDMLLISVGANDVGFADAVVKCMLPFDLCHTDTAFTNEIAGNIADLDARFNQLADMLSTITPAPPSRTYLTGYFDPTHKTSTVYCNGEPAGDPLSGIGNGEASWAFNSLIGPLNGKVSAAAQRHADKSWTFVDGMASDFAGHAYCSSTPWVNTAGVSLANQGDIWGMVHPNAAGYQQYAARMNTKWNQTFPNWSHFVGQDVPTSLKPGEVKQVKVRIKNTGAMPWYAGGSTPYRLGSQFPQDNNTWGLGRVGLAADVPIGGTYEFVFNITAPSTPGVYNFQWRMVQEHVQWFGDYTPNVQITVSQTGTLVPTPPVNLKDTFTRIGEVEKHTLTWTLTSSNQTQVVLKHREFGESTWKSITMPSATTTQYALSRLAFKPGHTYEFHVVACNATGCSAPSNMIVVSIG